MSETEFEKYVRDLGYDNVGMDEEIDIRDGADVLANYLVSTHNTKIVRLRDIYDQIAKIER